MTGFAFKMTLVLAVYLSCISAFTASSAGIPRIDLGNFDSIQSRLIHNKLKQPVETPAMHPPILLPALANPTTIPDVFEVFKNQRRSWLDCVHDLLGQNMIAVRAKPIDLPAQPFQHALSRLGAFALQDATVTKTSLLDVSPSFLSYKLVELAISRRHDRRTTNAQINSNNLAVRNKWLTFAVQNDMQEQPILFVPNKIGRTDLPVGIPIEVLRQLEFDFLTSNNGRQGCPAFFEFDHGGTFAVITDCLPLGLGTSECFGFELGILEGFGVAFVLKSSDRSKGFCCFGEGRTNELRREFCNSPFGIVVLEVDFDAVGGFEIPAAFGGSVEGLGILNNSFFEGLRGFGRAGKLESECYVHKVLTQYII